MNAASTSDILQKSRHVKWKFGCQTNNVPIKFERIVIL